MPKSSGNLALKGLDELLFSTEEQRQEEKREQVQQIPIDELHPFTNHPFKVVDDEAMTRTVESIAQFGVLAPLIARPRPDGDGYEIISGHRRQSPQRWPDRKPCPLLCEISAIPPLNRKLFPSKAARSKSPMHLRIRTVWTPSRNCCRLPSCAPQDTPLPDILVFLECVR